MKVANPCRSIPHEPGRPPAIPSGPAWFVAPPPATPATSPRTIPNSPRFRDSYCHGARPCWPDSNGERIRFCSLGLESPGACSLDDQAAECGLSVSRQGNLGRYAVVPDRGLVLLALAFLHEVGLDAKPDPPPVDGGPLDER